MLNPKIRKGYDSIVELKKDLEINHFAAFQKLLWSDYDEVCYHVCEEDNLNAERNPECGPILDIADIQVYIERQKEETEADVYHVQ